MYKRTDCASFVALALATCSSAGVAQARVAVTTDVAADAAQEAATASDGGEILVTARRREERLQDVPVAVTAISGEALEERSVVDVMDLGKTTPGLNITTSPRGNASPFVVMRGQRVIDTSIVLDSPVLFYVNEIPWMRMNGINQGFFDIGDVQVLRGPQGTLFGKSTTGGAVLINSKRPELAEFGGFARAHIGDYNLWRLEGAINVPIGDKLAVRFAGIVSRRDGYVISRDIAGLDQNNEHYDAQRLSIRYEDDGITNDLIVNRFSLHDNGTAGPVYALNENAPFLRFVLSPAQITQMKSDIEKNNADFYSTGNDFNTRYPDAQKSIDVTNITSVRLNDNLTLKNVFGYRKIDAPVYFDFDGSSVAYQEFTSYSYVKQFSDEIQLQGTSSNFDWSVGAFYLHEDGDDGASMFIRATNVTTESGTFATNESYSAFASGTYRFNDALSLTAGARISHDKREGDGYQRRNGNCTFIVDPKGAGTADDVLLAQPCLYHTEISFTEPSWQASLNYKVNPDLLLYIAHRHGYRSGGVQNRATTVPSARPFGAEKVNDVELGGKFQTEIGPDARLTFNLAGYKAWYTDLQRSLSFISDAGIIVTGITNAADATVTGVEAEANVRLGGFDLLGNVGYTKTKFQNFSQTLTPQLQSDLSNTVFSAVPKWTWSLTGSYTFEMKNAGEEVMASLSVNHVGPTITTELPASVGRAIPGYTVADARISWSSVGGTPVDLALSVTNLFDKAYINYGNTFATSTGWATRNISPPRRIQGSVTVNF